jgi:hypothetical protein
LICSAQQLFIEDNLNCFHIVEFIPHYTTQPQEFGSSLPHAWQTSWNLSSTGRWQKCKQQQWRCPHIKSALAQNGFLRRYREQALARFNLWSLRVPCRASHPMRSTGQPLHWPSLPTTTLCDRFEKEHEQGATEPARGSRGVQDRVDSRGTDARSGPRNRSCGAVRPCSTTTTGRSANSASCLRAHTREQFLTARQDPLILPNNVIVTAYSSNRNVEIILGARLASSTAGCWGPVRCRLGDRFRVARNVAILGASGLCCLVPALLTAKKQLIVSTQSITLIAILNC